MKAGIVPQDGTASILDYMNLSESGIGVYSLKPIWKKQQGSDFSNPAIDKKSVLAGFVCAH